MATKGLRPMAAMELKWPGCGTRTWAKWRVRKLRDVGGLPGGKGFMKTLDVSEAGRFGERATTRCKHEGDRTADGRHMGDRQGDNAGLETDAVLQRTWHRIRERPFRGRLTRWTVFDLGLHTGLDEGKLKIVQDPPFPVRRVSVRRRALALSI
ncbi:MAG: hypothetical protein OXC66_12500 [Roseovarius sp.]|nr:hypothetical protein [Roseovarius sp.]